MLFFLRKLSVSVSYKVVSYIHDSTVLCQNLDLNPIRAKPFWYIKRQVPPRVSLSKLVLFLDIALKFYI